MRKRADGGEQAPQSESQIQTAIRLALGQIPGLVLWRNNVGVARETDRNGRKRVVKYGLAVGSSDLCGILNGRWISLETKKPGEYPGPDQRKWLALVRLKGGFAAVVRSPEDALAAIARCAAGASE